MKNKQIEALRERLGEISDVRSTISLLHWDQQTYMPPKGGASRARQQATLSTIAHQMFTSPELGTLLHRLSDSLEKLDPDDAVLVSETLYDHDRARKLPDGFVRDLAEEEGKAFEAWKEARAKSEFGLFRPHLERLVEFQKRKAELLGFEGSPYNALIEDYERGMTAERLKGIFGDLSRRQSELVNRVVDSPRQPDLTWFDQEWDEGAQWRFGMRVLKDMGYDLEAGRQDKALHPFTASMADVEDVRITTRLDRRDPFSALSSTVHEGGHALYDQGYQPKDWRTPLARGTSMGMHESQSRLWENTIARSLPFWKHYLPVLRDCFPAQLERVTPEQIYRAQNRVKRSLIRVEADECTYNLHIILRFEIEIALLEGDLKVADIPEIWNVKMKKYLGIEVPDDAHGCLQDVHWSSACFGYFPTYALGNLYAAQMFEKILVDIPDLWDHVEQGNFRPLLSWLRDKVHRHGRRRRAPEIIREITGKEPGSEAYFWYLEGKYGSLYGL